MNRNILSLALLPMLFGVPASAHDLNDLQIAHAAYTAGYIDIRYAHLALALSENSDVRDFATTMVRDHAAVNDAAIALVTELNVTPEDNELSQTLVKGASDKRSELMSLEGKAFDCAYATNELAYHQVVNETIKDHFLPSVTVEPLKKLLEDALATFQQHEGHAEQMVAGLGCAS